MGPRLANALRSGAVGARNGDVCPCGASYDAHRTGLTFAVVRSMMRVGDEDPRSWRSKRRPAVLGFWRELKLMDWESLHGHCEEAREVQKTKGQIKAQDEAARNR